MMMTQSYHGGGDFDAFHRTPHRNMTNAAYYDRAAPYGLYDPRQELRHEYAGRAQTHTSIQEPDEPLTAAGQARRRISVAVNSKEIEMRPSGNSDAGTRQYSIDTSPPSSMGSGGHSYPRQHRPSLPILQTRTTWPADYDNQYESSPVDAYTYASTSAPRHDSLAGGYSSPEIYRSCTTAAPLSTPVSSPSYETGTYSFGTLQSPMPGHAATGRMPSVSAETMSALNMNSLHSSLPTNTPRERRLPAPFTVHYTQQPYMPQTLPEPRSIDSATANFRPYVNGVHSRQAMPWNNTAGSHTPSFSSTSPSHHQLSSALPTTTASSANPAFGYQFQPPGAYSPESSPTITATLSEPFPSTAATSMLPPAYPSSSLRYTASSTSLPAISASFDNPRPSSSRLPELHAPVASLYSYSSETADRESSEFMVRQRSSRGDISPGGEPSGSESSYVGYPQGRHHAQPHHSTSHDGLRRQSEYDQQCANAGPGHRTSVRSLNGRY